RPLHACPSVPTRRSSDLLLVLRCLLKDEGPLRLALRQLRLEWKVVRRILQVGLPAGFQGVVFSLSNVVIQSSINSFDNAALVARSEEHTSELQSRFDLVC